MKSFYEKFKEKKGFTLIELLAVIVILAILALIAIPIVINIIKDSRKSSARRSVDAFGRSTAAAVSNFMTKNDMGDYSRLLTDLSLSDQGMYINSFEDFQKVLGIKYSGTKVYCGTVCLAPSGAAAVSKCATGKDAVNSVNSNNKSAIVLDDDGKEYAYTSSDSFTDTSTVGTNIYYTNYGTYSGTAYNTVWGTVCYGTGCYSTNYVTSYSTTYNTSYTTSYRDNNYNTSHVSELLQKGFVCKDFTQDEGYDDYYNGRSFRHYKTERY